MTREEKRNKVICSCIEQQEHIATIAKQEMDSAQQQSNDYGANVDRYDSYRTKMMRSRDMYARQYSNAQTGVRYLQDLLKKFMVGNQVWFAISAQTPIYAALKGKKVGDGIVFNGQSQTIKEIF